MLFLLLTLQTLVFSLQTELPSASQFSVVDVEADYHLYGQRHHYRGLSEAHTSDGHDEHRVFRTLRFDHKKEKYVVALSHNTELFAPNYNVISDQPWDPNDKRHLCHYHGSVLKSDGSFLKGAVVAFSNCRNQGFSGSILHKELNVHMTPHHTLDQQTQDHHRRRLNLANGASLKPVNMHVLIDNEHMKVTKGTCGVKDNDGHKHPLGHHDHDHHHEHDHAEHDHTAHGKHEHTYSLKSMVDERLAASSSGDKHEQLQAHDTKANEYLELLVFNDKLRSAKGTVSVVTDSSATIVNLVAALYKVNSTTDHWQSVSGDSIVHVKLVQQVYVPTPMADPWGTVKKHTTASEVSVDDYLAKWNAWRSQPGQTFNSIAISAHDNGHVFSGDDFEDTVLGYAGVGTMCQASASGGINQVAFGTANDAMNAAVIAHEIGHNFGFRHDSSGNTCPQSGFVMNALIGTPPREFSPCSKAYYAQNQASRSCMSNVPTSTWGTPVCGNGFVEADGGASDEQCDCGANDANGQCLNGDACCGGSNHPTPSSRCKYIGSAVCSKADPCCNAATCQLTPAASKKVCRLAEDGLGNPNPCDVAEMCDGTQKGCPDDKFVAAGTGCTHVTYKAGLCYDGRCMSHNSQCAAQGKTFQANGAAEFLACGATFQIDKNKGNFCGTMYCTNTPGVCSRFPAAQKSTDADSGAFVTSPDGTPCKSGTTDMCMQGSCVSAAKLNPYNIWVAGAWTSCASCSETQVRTIQCKTVPKSGSPVVVDDALCTPSAKPTSAQKCLNPALNCVHGANDNSFDKAARELAAKYNLLDKAEQLRNMIPRFGYSTVITADFETDYWKGVAILGLIPWVMAFFTLVYQILFCCTKKGCCRLRPRKSYSRGAKLGLWVFLCFWYIVSLGWDSVGIFYNAELNRGLTDKTVGALAVVSKTLADTNNYLTLFSRPLDDFVSQGQAKLPAEVTRVNTAAATAAEGASKIIKMANDLKAYVQANKIIYAFKQGNGAQIGTWPPTPSYALTCTDNWCSTYTYIDDIVTEATNDLQTPYLQFNAQVQATKDTVTQASFMSLESFEGSFVQIQGSINNTRGIISGIEKNMTQYRGKMEEWESIRYKFSLGVFALVPFACVAYLLTIPATMFLKQGGKCHLKLMHFTWFITWMMWLMFGFALCLAATFGDSCTMMTQSENDPMLYTNLTTTESAVVKACLANVSVTQALNMTDFLNNVEAMGAVSAGTAPNFATLWTDTKAKVTALKSGWDGATGTNKPEETDWSNGLDTYTSITTANANQPNYPGRPAVNGRGYMCMANTNYQTTCDQNSIGEFATHTAAQWLADGYSQAVYDSEWKKVYTMRASIRASSEIAAVVAQLTVLKDALFNYAASHEAASVAAVSAQTTVTTNLASLVTASKVLRQASNCGEVGNYYRQFKATWCDVITLAFSIGALAYLNIVIAGYFMIIFGGRAVLLFTTFHGAGKNGAVVPYEDQDEHGDVPPAFQHQHTHGENGFDGVQN